MERALAEGHEVRAFARDRSKLGAVHGRLAVVEDDAFGPETAVVNKPGVHVRSGISNTLAGIGLDHVPQVLPNYRHEQVRIFESETLGGDPITTVLTPGEQTERSPMNGMVAVVSTVRL